VDTGFARDKRKVFARKSWSNKKIDRGDALKNSHLALVLHLRETLLRML
jgi:hypothetical protein